MTQPAMNPQQRYFQNWYAKNRERLNAERRHRYQTDPEYRRKAIAVSARYRSKKEHVRKPPIQLVRVVNGVPVPVFSAMETAQQIGRSAQSIRKWERRGWIPAPIFPGRRRLYTAGQISLIQRLADVLEDCVGRHSADKQSMLATTVRIIHEHWMTP